MPLKNTSQDVGHMTHSMYPLFRAESDGVRSDLDPTLEASTGASFRFTPSLLDPNSSAFAAFAAQPPGYYTPTPGGPQHLDSSRPNWPPTPKRSIVQIHCPTQPKRNVCAFHLSTTSPRSRSYELHAFPSRSLRARQLPRTHPGSAIGGAGSESSLRSYSPESPVEQRPPIQNSISQEKFMGTFLNAGFTQKSRYIWTIFPQFAYSAAYPTDSDSQRLSMLRRLCCDIRPIFQSRTSTSDKHILFQSSMSRPPFKITGSNDTAPRSGSHLMRKINVAPHPSVGVSGKMDVEHWSRVEIPINFGPLIMVLFCFVLSNFRTHRHPCCK